MQKSTLSVIAGLSAVLIIIPYAWSTPLPSFEDYTGAFVSTKTEHGTSTKVLGAVHKTEDSSGSKGSVVSATISHKAPTSQPPHGNQHVIVKPPKKGMKWYDRDEEGEFVAETHAGTNSLEQTKATGPANEQVA